MGLLDSALGAIGLGTPDQPAAPDYKGAAEETAAGNLAQAQYATEVNRPTQVTPFGTTEWTRPEGEVFDQAAYERQLADYNARVSGEMTTREYNAIYGDKAWGQGAPQESAFYSPSTDWTQTTTLSPEQQAIFEQQQQTGLTQAQYAQQALESTGDLFSTRFQTGYDPIGDYSDRRGDIEASMRSRVDVDIARARESKSADLIARGIPEGSEAYNREMEQLDRRQTDAYQQAEIAATQQTSQMLTDDINLRRQGISELLAERQTPLNEFNAFRSGEQVTSPQFSGFAKQQAVAGPDYLGATTATGNWDLAGWNADVAQQNAILGGLFGVGAAFAGKPPTG